MREMEQSAWLNTSSPTLQGSEGKSQRGRDWERLEGLDIMYQYLFCLACLRESSGDTPKGSPCCKTTVGDRDICPSCKMLKKAVQQGRSE